MCKRPAARAIANAAAGNAVPPVDRAAMASSAKIRVASPIAGGDFSRLAQRRSPR
jgi:hypothetical protein